MDKQEQLAWWDKIPTRVGGDVIVADVGANAAGVAVGKNIAQTVVQTLGGPTPNDRQIIEEKLAQVRAALQQADGQLDSSTATMAQFQVNLLQGELIKTEPDEAPSANTITQVGDWLLDNVPQIAEALVDLFATPAVGKVVGLAGALAVTWVKARFGKGS